MLIVRSSFGRILVVLTGVLIILSALGVLNMSVGSFIEFIIGSIFLTHGIYGILMKNTQNIGSLIFGTFLILDSLKILDLRFSQIVWILIGCILISIGMTRIRTRWRP